MAGGNSTVDPRRVVLLLLGALLVLAGVLLMTAGPSSVIAALKDRWHMSPIRYGWMDRDLLHASLAEGVLGGGEGTHTNPSGEVVIIVMDTVRRDHLGLYGYGPRTSPRLDAWAAGARVYTRARSTSAWTVPSHGSLFTGLLPIEHGAHGLAPEERTWEGVEDALALPEGSRTLATALAEQGYATVGIAANRAYLNRGYGLDQGFQVWLCEDMEDPPDGVCPRARRITDLAIETLAQPRSKPLLLFLNYMDAHIPYRGHQADDAALPTPERPFSGREKWWRERMATVLEDRSELEPWERDLLTEAYDQEIRYLDDELGRLLERLPDLGIDERDTVVITADHGEYLGEHSLLEHSYDLYESVLEVPLVVRGPGFPAGRDDDPLLLSELPAEALDSLGLQPLPGPTIDHGLQVSELYFIRHADLRNEAMFERFHRVRRAFVRDDHKLLTTDGRCVEAYDLALDPGEHSPVTGEPWVQQLCEEATSWHETVEPGEGEAPRPQVGSEAMLEALGYL